MQAAGKRTDGRSSRLPITHPSGLSGQRARTLAPELRALDQNDFQEPDPELVSLVEPVAARAPDLSELSQARRIPNDHEPTIEALSQRVSSLESEKEELLDQLRASERQLELLKQSLAPTPRETFTASVPPPHAALPCSAPSLYPEFAPAPVLQRVSVSLRESMSVPPPSRPDAVPPSRRRQPRLSLELELEFKDETHFYAGITQDLSQGGVFIATYNVFPVGSRLELGFQLPDGAEVRCRGVVRWVRGEGEPDEERPGMGVAFTELSEQALSAIAKYCRKRAPLYMEL
jgi:uncharacterized protein (TIGR02266 family)